MELDEKMLSNLLLTLSNSWQKSDSSLNVIGEDIRELMIRMKAMENGLQRVYEEETVFKQGLAKRCEHNHISLVWGIAFRAASMVVGFIGSISGIVWAIVKL